MPARRLLAVPVNSTSNRRDLRNTLWKPAGSRGERFPEYEDWLAAEKAEKAEHWKKVKELEGDPTGLLLYGLEKLIGKKAADVPKPSPARAACLAGLAPSPREEATSRAERSLPMRKRQEIQETLRPGLSLDESGSHRDLYEADLSEEDSIHTPHEEDWSR